MRNLNQTLFAAGTEIEVVMPRKTVPGAITDVTEDTIYVYDGEGQTRQFSRKTLRGIPNVAHKLILVETVPYPVGELTGDDIRPDMMVIIQGVNVDGLTLYNQTLVRTVGEELITATFFGNDKLTFVRDSLHEWTRNERPGWKIIGKWVGVRPGAI